MTDYFKVLDYDGSAFHGGRGKWTKGRWRSVRGRLDPCRNGLHLCTLEQLLLWLGPTIWRAEVHPDSEIIEDRDKVVVRKARVVERLPWDERTAGLFAADCAEHVLGIFESALPGDDRPRRAVEAARAYANGEIGEEELRAAGADAWDAAEAAGWAAASAWAAATATWCAIEAARGAARAAADAAEAAAWVAARDAADAAIAAWAAATADERSWQAQRLAHYLGTGAWTTRRTSRTSPSGSRRFLFEETE
jgi:hypothetical protein